MRAWVNGRVLPDATEAAIPVLDHGLTVGDGVFESIQVNGGRPFALTRHLERLSRSAEALGLRSPDHDTFHEGIESVIGSYVRQPSLGRLRLTYTAGNAPMGSDRGEGPPLCVVVYGPVQPQPETTTVVTVPWVRNDRGALAGIKSTSYAENVRALAYARERGATEAIFANTRDLLCEGTGSNIFYVVDGEIRTPTLESGCLAGVTRELALEWFAKADLPVREVDESLTALETADEVFLTSTFRDVQAVERCDSRGLVAPGPLTRRARSVWAEESRLTLDP